MKSKVGLLIGVLLAILGTGLLYIYLTSLEPVVISEIQRVDIVVPKHDISAKMVITSDLLELISIPAEGLSTAVATRFEDVVGKYAIQTLYAGGQIHMNALTATWDNDLSFQLKESYRAVSLALNGNSGISGLLKVGDLVDVVVYLPQLTEQGRIVRPDVTKMFLQNIEIIAIDRSLFREDQQDLGDEIAMFHVTLSVPALAVEDFVLAKSIGTVELALRPMEGDRIYVTGGRIWQELLLNDLYKIKDLFPNYGVVGKLETELTEGNYVYDEYLYYTIQYGDTLSKISLKFYGNFEMVPLLMLVNRITDENLIVTGTGIKIPILVERGDDDGN